MSIIKSNGIDIEYFIHGLGEPVIFVHGSSLDASFYDETTSLLEGDFKIITYNRRGYGKSSRYKETGTIGDQVEDLKGLMDGIGIKSAHLNGHSSGGAICFAFAMKYPDMVQTISLDEAMLWQSMPIAEEIINAFAGVGEKYEREGAKAAMCFAWEMMCGGDVYQRMPEGGFDRIIENIGTYFIEIGAFVKWIPTREELSSVKIPILSIIGEKSKEIHYAYQKQHDLVKECLPHTIEYTLPNATHLLFIENPTDFADAIKGFLKKNR
ncbi:MAG: alpha/beta hydrolase [Nitrospirae bacterium]|nr:alpha/beta hydrolase [Nitrospirota bacterium]MBF0540524.1 alpha/beta hydrolase [Nitrospirota bacterium]